MCSIDCNWSMILLQAGPTWVRAGGHNDSRRPTPCCTQTSSQTPWTSRWRSLRPSRPSSMSRPSQSSLSRWVTRCWSLMRRRDDQMIRWLSYSEEQCQSIVKWGLNWLVRYVWQYQQESHNTITLLTLHRKSVRNWETFSHSFNENILRTVKSIIDV